MSGENSSTDSGAPPDEGLRGGLFGRRMQLQTPRETLQPEAPPPPPQKPPSKRRPTLSALSGFFTLLLVVAAAVAAVGAYAQHQLHEAGPLQADKVVAISPRTEVQDILAQLEREGVIDNAALMNVTLLIDGNRSRVKAGEYLFRAHASMRDVIDTLVSGREVMHSITIPEGLTSEQILDRLNQNELLAGDVRDLPKEGSLLPETYRVPRGMSRADLVRKMQEDQKKALEQIWARRSPDIPLHSPFELVTLASIVEKETGKADERPRVAGVFLNRLQKRMKLQSDPTIVYGLVGGKGTLGRGILRSEVDKPTPYNTYAIEGLPPGPITNPGRAAMEAVANPSRTKDLYFVADGSGGHVFAETVDQHNKNVSRWRQIEKDAKERAAAGQTPTPAIDHFVPDPGAPPAANAPLLRDQRGEADAPATPVFGSLSTAFRTQSKDALAYSAPATPLAIPAAAAIDQAQRAMASSVASDPAKPIAGTPANPSPVQTAAASPTRASQGLTNLSLGGEIDGGVAAQFGDASTLLDGPDPGSATGSGAGVNDPGVYPESPQKWAEQKARAARYGASYGADTLPAADTNPDDADRTPPPEPTGGPRVVRIYDASEGTPLDPLKDKTWDLNSAKTVPIAELAPVPPPPGPRSTLPAARSKPKAAAKRATVEQRGAHD